MSLSNRTHIPINNLYKLPAKDLYVYLSNPRNKTKHNQVIYKGVKPPIKAVDGTDMFNKLSKQFKRNEHLKKYLSIFLTIDNEYTWIDSQNWDYPGYKAEIKQNKRNYLDLVMMTFITFAQNLNNAPEYTQQLPVSAWMGMGNIKHGYDCISKMDEWNMDQILTRCIEIFDQMQKRENCNSRPIYPDPKYMIHGNEARGKAKQWNLGKNFVYTQDPLGELALFCSIGNWELFQSQLLFYFGNNVDFNSLLIGEIEFPLLYLTISGHTKLTRGGQEIQYISEPFTPSHFKIAQYMIDNGLDVDIQNKFGYTALQEAVINYPNIEGAKFLLNNGANPNIYNIFCGTALHGASMQINVECVKLLCDYGANPLLLNFQGYRALDIQSARNHIEIYTILCNQARKIKENKAMLEYQDASYCFICKRSNKNSKLYRCAKCISSERYCSIKCQKIDWKRHKTVCNRNRMRITKKSYVSQKQLVFSVVYCGDDIMPMWQCQNQLPEWIKNKSMGPRIAEFGGIEGIHEEYHDKYRRKRGKKCEKEYEKRQERAMKGKVSMKSLYPPCGINLKFVVKIQVYPNDKSLCYILCYDKSREYMVKIFKRKQAKKYKKLYKFVVLQGIDTNNAKKGYFYAFVDKKKKVHILIDEMVAAQPW